MTTEQRSERPRSRSGLARNGNVAGQSARIGRAVVPVITAGLHCGVLTDGREFRWERSYERGRRWLDDSPTVTAEIVDLNDVIVVDDREVSFDTVEVRRGDVVLATIRVESSEDEAPYAAAVAEFGDVTWL